MAIDSKIEWTTHTWNPWVGCTPVSAGCDNCYMFREQRRFGYDPTIVRRTTAATWAQVQKFNAGDKVFVCSWGDFWHPAADRWRDDAMRVIDSRRDLTWLILTKRIDRVFYGIRPPANVWLGVTIESADVASRIVNLAQLRIPGKTFISFEPLLSEIHDAYSLLTHKYPHSIDWIIIGCESGPARRPCELSWVKGLIRQADKARLPVFVKQLSIDGQVNRNLTHWPLWARRREFPRTK